MKKFLVLFFCGSVFLVQAKNVPFNNKKSSYINNLNWVEISKERYTPQVMMDFSKPLYFEKKVDQNTMALEFAFPGMNLKEFEKHNLVQNLRAISQIKKVELIEKKAPSPRVVLTITFNSNDVLVRWYKMEDPNRLVLDLFSKRSLAKCKKNGSMVLYAQNDFIRPDAQGVKKKSSAEGLIKINDNLLSRNVLPRNKIKNFSIVVDAGHGKDDTGANGFFALKEKDVSLDIAQRVGSLLKKKGFKTSLTRNSDTNLTLLERSELAGQLKADLFVSIHANAVKCVENISGIETYFLNPETLLTPKRQGGYLFATKNDMQLAAIADDILKKNANLSKSLAGSIQKNIVSFLQDHKISPVDRGAKAARFRILLRSEIPVALIEVGFLTNKKEARRLGNSAYRNMLAQGIVQGIEEYVCSNK